MINVNTATGVTIQKNMMFLTSWKNISVYDISDPGNPQQLDIEPIGFRFENEQVQVTPDGRYLFFAESLPGNALHIWDVEDKTNIAEVATVEGAGDHTTSCILKCKYLYGSDGSIVDVRDPLKPKLLAAAEKAADTLAKSGRSVTASMVSAGEKPAVISALASGLLLNYLFTPPIYTWTIADPENAFAILVFVVVGIAAFSLGALVWLVVPLLDRRPGRHLDGRLRLGVDEVEGLAVQVGLVG